MKKQLYTIILSHYNQMEFIEQALNSIFIQKHKNIEVIIADDCSKEFDKDRVEKIILENKTANIKKYKIISNKANLGTVKSLNNALTYAHGEYVHFFAADDALYDENVVSNFVNEFEKNEDYLCITSQCLMYDSNMNECYNKYVNANNATRNNKLSALEQYKKLAFGCIYGAGGTAYRKSVFQIQGNFNEEYKLVEDWAYWLHLTRNGVKILYVDFISLKHREGGVSHSLHEKKKKNLPPHVKQYYLDILNIFENEIFKFTKHFSLKQRNKMIDRYRDHVRFYLQSIPDLKKQKDMYTIKLIIANPLYAIKKILKKVYLKKQVIISVLVWYSISTATLANQAVNYKTMVLIIIYYFIIRFLVKMFFLLLKKVFKNEE